MKSQTLTKPQTVTSQQVADDEFLTTRELMKLLKIKHRQTIYELIKSGLPAILVRKNYRIQYGGEHALIILWITI